MRINNNLMAMNTHRQLGINNTGTAKSLEKLSSGFRINRAGDDAAGLAISEKMRGQIRGLNMASKNAQDGISFIQTAEGALTESHAILQRMRELAVQSANDTNVKIDRSEIQKEMDQLSSELTRIANDTEFNTQTLLNGGITDTKFHIGANQDQNIQLAIKAMDAKTLGVAGTAFEATVEGGVKVSGVEIDQANKGTAITDGGSLTLSANATAAKTTWAAGNTGLTAMTISSKDNSSTYNDYTITINKAGGSGADPAVSVAGKSITITLASDASAVDKDKLNIAFTAAGLDLEADASATAVAEKTDLVASTAGLAADEVKLTAGTESIIVKNNATSATFTGAANKGLTVKFDGTALDATVAGTINISEKDSTVATFNADGTLKDKAVSVAGIKVSDQASANTAVTTIQSAIETVSAERSKLGAMQNRLEHTIKNLDNTSENLQAAESRIRDVDMAKEMMEFTKQNILQQAATAMLAQANQMPSTVLQLLR
ncbi:flagellin N-terminal helical domain-containing protein [Sporanaerobacter acetigenes]|uniref:flagellin N-terminal helical domain-containing protein n=1 Tax=Sporanaerobacter acetigenes TaxID=165813 RepID=UPI00104BD4ED|nr:flagellin [Sporanaerobacter acetigenes]